MEWEWDDKAVALILAGLSTLAGGVYLKKSRGQRAASKESFPEGLPKVARTPEEPQHDRLPVPGAGERWPDEDWLPGFQSVTGERLFTTRHLPKRGGQPRGIVFLWHGMGDHMRAHAHLARAFAEEGYAVYGMDFVGFGQSGGLSGYISSIDVNVQDSLRYMDTIVGFSPPPDIANGQSQQSSGSMWREKVGLPVFIFGQSLGGAHCLRLALARPGAFDGTVVLAPAINLASDLNLLLTMVAEVGGTLWPTGPVARIKHGLGSRNPAVTDWEAADPLRTHGYIRFGSVKSIVQSCRKIAQGLSELRLPFLVLQGMKDTIVSPGVVDMLMKNAPSTDKTSKLYEDAWHDLIHEPEAEEIISTVIDWVKAHSKGNYDCRD